MPFFCRKTTEKWQKRGICITKIYKI